VIFFFRLHLKKDVFTQSKYGETSPGFYPLNLSNSYHLSTNKEHIPKYNSKVSKEKKTKKDWHQKPILPIALQILNFGCELCEVRTFYMNKNNFLQQRNLIGKNLIFYKLAKKEKVWYDSYQNRYIWNVYSGNHLKCRKRTNIRRNFRRKIFTRQKIPSKVF